MGQYTSSQRRCDDGEHELVDHKRLFGNGGRVVGIGCQSHATQEDVLEAADEGVSVAKGQRIANNGPQNRHESHHGEALHHGAQDVLAPDQAAVEKRQAGPGHQQNEGC